MKLFLTFLLLIVFSLSVFSQEEEEIQDSVEVILIQAFISPEKPGSLILSYFTSEPVKSKAIFNTGEIFQVRDSLDDNHNAVLDITGVKADTTFLKFQIEVTTEEGKVNRSEIFEVELPGDYLPQLAKDNSALSGCLVGGAIYMIPGLVHHYCGGSSYFGVNKELPVISYFRGGYNYPIAYLAAEYSHFPKLTNKNYLTISANAILEVKYIEYLSAGAGYTTDFRDVGGANLDVSAGLFRVFNVFTLYVKNRFGFNSGTGGNYSQQSIGLYSSFFSIQI